MRIIFLLPAKAAIFLMRFAGEIIFQIARLTPIKRTTANNIKAFFPGLNYDLLADRALKNVSYAIFEVLSLPFFNAKHFSILSKVIGKENLDLALRKGKGALIVSMHTGNYEIVPSILASNKYKVNSILKADENPIFTFLEPSRSHGGVKLINILKDDMYKESLNALKNNEVVCLMLDTGASEGRHIEIDFLGKKVIVASGWITLAKRAECEVVPVFCRREKDKIIVQIDKPLTIKKATEEENMWEIKEYFEMHIRQSPDQWLMFINDQETKRMLEHSENK